MASQFLTAVFELHPTRAKGRRRPKAGGQRMGHPLKLTPQQQTEARRRGEGATPNEPATSHTVGRAAISRLAA
jgi:hypothetical protein